MILFYRDVKKRKCKLLVTKKWKKEASQNPARYGVRNKEKTFKVIFTRKTLDILKM